jgi:hypothetical protein
MNALVKMPGKGLASSSRKGDGLVAMNQALEDFMPALAISNRYGRQWQASICTIGLVGEPRSVDTARKIHHGFLPVLVEMDQACEKLKDVVRGHPAVDRATALSMLNVLFAAIGKRKSDEESSLLLAAAADMFDPGNDVLGCITGVERINRHPLVLAIAIKQLIATAKFTSCAELREAMAKVANSIGISISHLEFVMEAIDRADAMLFEKDRAAWDAAYANGDSKVVLAMREWSELAGEGPSEDEDENGNPEFPPSPRWQALAALIEAKNAEQVKLAPPPERKRIAAARKRGNVKRTRKPKPLEADHAGE